MKNKINQGKFGIYIHWPYCIKKCPYCAFNSYVTIEEGQQKEYYKGLKENINKYVEKYDFGKMELNSIFFGGGTPSLMEPEYTKGILEEINKSFSIKDIEITLEANPTTYEANKFKEFQIAGINRLSLGVQSFDEKYLKILGRNHSAKEAREAIEGCREIYNNYSFDLIYAVEKQTVEHHQNQIKQAIEYGSKHISAYQLTIEPNTVFYKQKKKEVQGELALDFYEATVQDFKKAGYMQYEISNFAKEGYESEHNKGYWQGYDYLGIGAGAASRFYNKKESSWEYIKQIKNPKKWIEENKKSSLVIEDYDKIKKEDRIEEIIITSLRTKKGVRKELILDKKRIIDLKENGFIEEDKERYKIKESKLAVTDKIVEYIIN